jgi:hypothetical protein
MGKAIVISVTVVVLAMLLIGAAMWATREKRSIPRDDRDRDRLLNRAHKILSEAGAAHTIEDSDVLSHRTMAARDEWLQRYNNYNRRKEI